MTNRQTSDAPSSRLIALTQPISKAAFDYWNAARNGRALPHRRDIDPSKMRGFLPQVMLLEFGRDADAVFRLAGTSVCHAFGREMRDHSFLSVWETSHRGVVSGALASSLKKPSALLLRFSGHALARRPVAGEIMLLPLIDDTGKVTRLLGSFAFTADPAGSKAFTRLELARAESIMPCRDRVELHLEHLRAPRAELKPVDQTTRVHHAQTRSERPWAGLFREFLNFGDELD